MISHYSEPTKTHFIPPQNIISRFGCHFRCRLNLCPVRVVFLLMRSARVKPSKSLARSYTHRHPRMHANTKGHQVRPSVTQSPLNSTPHCSDLLPPKLQLYECCLKCRGHLHPYSILSFLITTASGQVRSQG